MSEFVLQTAATLETITCGACGIQFAVPDYWKKKRLEDRKAFWCPNGHERYFTAETEADKLKREVDRLAQARARTLEGLAQAQMESEHLTRVARGLRGALAKAKKRQVKP